jgi:hypothetical protein
MFLLSCNVFFLQTQELEKSCCVKPQIKLLALHFSAICIHSHVQYGLYIKINVRPVLLKFWPSRCYLFIIILFFLHWRFFHLSTFPFDSVYCHTGKKGWFWNDLSFIICQQVLINLPLLWDSLFSNSPQAHYSTFPPKHSLMRVTGGMCCKGLILTRVKRT